MKVLVDTRGVPPIPEIADPRIQPQKILARLIDWPDDIDLLVASIDDKKVPFTMTDDLEKLGLK